MIELAGIGQWDAAQDVLALTELDELRDTRLLDVAAALLDGGRRDDAFPLVAAAADLENDRTIYRFFEVDSKLTKETGNTSSLATFTSRRSQLLSDISQLAADDGELDAAQGSLELIGTGSDRALADALRVLRLSNSPTGAEQGRDRSTDATAPADPEPAAVRCLPRARPNLAAAAHGAEATTVARRVASSVGARQRRRRHAASAR